MKPQRTQSKTYILITACRKKLFISALVPLCSLWLIFSTLSGCASTKEVKPSTSQENNPPVAASAAQENNPPVAASAAQENKAPEEQKNESLQPAEEPKQRHPDEEVLMPQVKKSLSQKPLPP